jgi:integral membrane sensor domain MASE1
MNYLEQRIWTHQEVMDILAALHAAVDALPWPLRWLLRGWSKALACLGYALELEAQKQAVAQLWTPEKLQGHVLALVSAKSGRAWPQALVAAAIALGLEIKPTGNTIGNQVERWLNSQWN